MSDADPVVRSVYKTHGFIGAGPSHGKCDSSEVSLLVNPGGLTAESVHTDYEV